MLNKCILIGRICTDLELKFTTGGKPYVRFNLAVNRVGEGTDFITVVVWNKQAENLIQYQTKGSLISVEGSLNVSNYTDKEGNKRNSYEVMAQNIQYLGSKKEEVSQSSTITESDPFAEFGEMVSIDGNFLD